MNRPYNDTGTLRSCFRVLAILLILAGIAACHRGTVDRRGGVYHTVRKGQTLWSICSRYGVDIREVQKINNIKNPNKIFVGQKIFIPGPKSTRTVPPTVEPSNQAIPSLIWPVKGKVTRRFGIREGERHDGIDISAPRGTSVIAAADGLVIYSDNDIKGYGNLVIIQHEGDVKTVYGHNLVNLVSQDEVVKQGRVISKVGSTGRSSGPHLHFEVRVGRNAQDPMKYLP